MGHRREIFKPRISKKKVAPQIIQALDEGNFDKAVQLSLSHFTNKKTADVFSTSLLATAEAFNLANEQRWTRSIEEVTFSAIKNTEVKKEISLSRFERQTVFKIVSNALRKQVRREGGGDI